jgi:CelD/BcsL family acetyltransferase involved in cellulose biosynthesis
VNTASLKKLPSTAPQAYPGATHALPQEPEALAPTAESLWIEPYETLESTEKLRGEWEALLEHFPHGSTFSTWEWLASWWRAYARNDRLLVLALRDSACSLMGLAPLGLTAQRVAGATLRSLRLMGDGSHDSDNLDLPVRSGYETGFSRRLLDWLQQHSREWDICQLRTLPARSPMGHQLLNDLKVRGWGVHASTHPQSVVELPQNWEAYLKGLSSKERGKIGLRARRLEKKYRVRIRKCQERAELESALETLFELHGSHWQLRGLPGSFQVPERRRFYRELAPLLLSRQRLEFWLLELDEKIVAAQFALRHGETVYSLQEGFDPEYSSDSVGYVLRGHVLRNLIDRGIRRYDFLGGAGESKTRWGAEVRSYLDIEFAKPHSKGAFFLSLKHHGAGLKTWLRTNLPHPLVRTLKQLGGGLADDN